MKTKIPTPSKSNNINPKNSRALPLQLVQDAQADRTYYLKSTASEISNFFSLRVKELYNTLAWTFSLDSMDWSTFNKYIWPTISSGAALVLGNYLTPLLSEYLMGSPEYDFVIKFIFGGAVLGYCALNRITDNKLESGPALSVAVASEVMAIIYMYSSIFKGTTFFLTASLLMNIHSLQDWEPVPWLCPVEFLISPKKFKKPCCVFNTIEEHNVRILR